jgi:hypothetical protein
MRILLLVALVASIVGCTDDPDASVRDRAHAAAEDVAESLELPAGYEVVEFEASRAQTPEENRGGGQGGEISLRLEPPTRLSSSEVLADFDSLFTGQGMVRADWTRGKSQCTAEQVHMKWADAEKVAILQYWTEGPKYVLIPYGYSGMVTADTGAVETDVPLPSCS